MDHVGRTLFPSIEDADDAYHVPAHRSVHQLGHRCRGHSGHDGFDDVDGGSVLLLHALRPDSVPDVFLVVRSDIRAIARRWFGVEFSELVGVGLCILCTILLRRCRSALLDIRYQFELHAVSSANSGRHYIRSELPVAVNARLCCGLFLASIFSDNRFSIWKGRKEIVFIEEDHLKVRKHLIINRIL